MAHLEHDSPVKPEIPANTFSSYRRIAQRNTIVAALAAFVVGVILFPLIAVWVLAVRWLEVHEQKVVPEPDPPVDARTYAMEDLFIQNHLATIGVVKDNPVRRFSIRTAVALTGILFQRILLRGGFGGVFTLHFAHVVWLDEGRRILLLTGYDGSALEYPWQLHRHRRLLSQRRLRQRQQLSRLQMDNWTRRSQRERVCELGQATHAIYARVLQRLPG